MKKGFGSGSRSGSVQIMADPGGPTVLEIWIHNTGRKDDDLPSGGWISSSGMTTTAPVHERTD
jgi:hypothetical protein